MQRLIDIALSRSRTVILLLLLILVSGTAAYLEIPRESAPDVKIPIIYVSMTHEGISPEDAERLLIRPMEKELSAIESVKEIRATAREGFASVIIEFEAGFDSEKALDDVREKVDLAKVELPEETDEPDVQEVNFSLFPVVNVILSGEVSDRTLLRIARDLRDKLETVSSVLDVDIAGDREEVLEVTVHPRVIEEYQLDPVTVISQMEQNNVLIPAGKLDTGLGSYPIKVPGLLEELEDFYDLPVTTDGDAVVTLEDIAKIRRTFKDAEGYARVNGKPAIVLEVVKRTGENIIETVESVREIVGEERKFWPQTIDVTYGQDISEEIEDRVTELQNNVILAIWLVVIVIIAVMGARSAVLVGLAIPGAFLMSILALSGMDMTLNIVVLFSLILSVGMLVDSAIVVCEFADRKMLDGMSHLKAYGVAAKRMATPILSSTLTTLVVFMPLLFWPGVVGQFMKYMPITLICTLTSSLFMALIFLPTLGGFLGKRKDFTEGEVATIRAGEDGDFEKLGAFAGGYVNLLNRLLGIPGRFVLLILALLIAVYAAYIFLGRGVEFFPDIEPENASVLVKARGNLAVDEKDAIVAEVEQRLLGMEEVRIVYARSGAANQQQDLGEDVIGVIQLEFVDWDQRRPADAILKEVRDMTADIAGIQVETRKQEGGPPVGKPIQIQFSSRFPQALEPAVRTFLTGLEQVGGFTDVENDLPIPAIEMEMQVNRELAGRYGINVGMVGNFIKFITNGIIASTYRPDDADDEIDITVRFPIEYRSISQLDRLRVVTADGAVPISHFVTREPKQQVGTIRRVDGQRVYNVRADVRQGILPDTKVQELRQWLSRQEWDPRVQVTFKGEDEEQQEAAAFLQRAFLLALTIMIIIMTTQFNSIYSTLVVMSAVFFSTVGVLLGLLITAQPFGIVMCGVGVIALAGIVVNNNIIFIDTYNEMLDKGLDHREALLRTGAQRLRPILLTAGTTVLGLTPMVIGMGIDFVDREVSFGAPSSQWWTQLSTSIAGGLTFATILTLLLTPCLLMLGVRFQTWWRRKRQNAS